jgi:hypothetical protein
MTEAVARHYSSRDPSLPIDKTLRTQIEKYKSKKRRKKTNSMRNIINNLERINAKTG